MPVPTCDPQTLMDEARCFRCLSPGSLRDVQTMLLCQWAANVRPVTPPAPQYPCGVPSNTIVITLAGEPGANLTYIQSADPNVWLPAGGDTTGWHISGNYLSNGETTWYQATLFPCAWALMGSEGGPAPSGMYGAPFAWPCGVPSNTIQISGAGNPEANQIYTQLPPPDETVFVAPNGWEISLANGVWFITDAGSNPWYSTSSENFPCVWTNDNIDPPQPTAPPAPTGQYI